MSNPPTLLAKIDWYSFTVPLVTPLSNTGKERDDVINQILETLFGNAIDPFEAVGTWTLSPAHGFYAWRATHVGNRLALSWGDINPHLFVELSGQACTWAREANVFDRLVKMTHNRASRVDAAIDIVTTTTPEQFVLAGHAERFKDSLGNIKSKTGDTYYVGSRKSDRCARVYRYFPPHPRSRFLRVEAEYKGTAARILAEALSNDGQVQAVRQAHECFEWKSTELDPDFLQSVRFLDELRISLGMENIAGLLQPSYPPSSAIKRLVRWMSERGWRTWYYQD